MKKLLKGLGITIAVIAGLLVIAAIGLLLVPPYSTTAQIDFTRHLSQHQTAEAGQQAQRDAFFGVPGAARVIVTRSSPDVAPAIQLNGEEIAVTGSPGALEFEVPVELLKDNTIAVALAGPPGSSASVRVKQWAELELHVQSFIHFNTNVSDIEAGRAFYQKLGMEPLSGFPNTNTLEMAHAMGIETPTSYDGSQGPTAGGYLLDGSIMGFGSFGGGVIDLIEFTIPRNDEPPYARINRLGMAKAAMETTDIAADYAYLTGMGVEFISAPATRSDGTQFAIFKDPDGTFYELVEIEGENQPTETTHIRGLGHLNINVSDFERSRAWYQMMGYELTAELPRTESPEVSKAMGFGQSIERRAAILTHVNDGSTLELVQWIAPYDPAPPYPVPINHFGIHRTALLSADIEADVAAPQVSGRRVHFGSHPLLLGQRLVNQHHRLLRSRWHGRGAGRCRPVFKGNYGDGLVFGLGHGLINEMRNGASNGKKMQGERRRAGLLPRSRRSTWQIEAVCASPET